MTRITSGDVSGQNNGGDVRDSQYGPLHRGLTDGACEVFTILSLTSPG